MFGHESLQTNDPAYAVNDTGCYRPSLVYSILWDQTLLPTVGDWADIDVAFFPNTPILFA